MYLSNAQTEMAALRQGDILGEIQLVGALNLSSMRHQIPVGAEEAEAEGWTVPAAPKMGYGMVLSHSCEIARENDVKLTSVILAPLRNINHATARERVRELIESNIIDVDNPAPSYLKYFYIQPSPRIPFPDGAVVDFSKLFSVRKNAFDFLLGKKKLQLEKDIQEAMAFKLALYFHRAEQPRDAA